jgi:hypothetical protein
MKESISFSESQEIIAAQRQELEELRDLRDEQARIIESMQEQEDYCQQRVLQKRAQRKLERKFAEDEADVEQLSKQGR